MNKTVNDKLSHPVSRDGYASLDDSSLMALVQSANHDAFAEIVGRHTTKLLSLARRTLGREADAEDVVQSVFIKLWQRPHAWSSDKSSLTTWLYRVVLNACYDQGRSLTRRTALESQVDDDSSYKEPDVLDQINAQEQAEMRNTQLQTAIASLPDSQRDALNLAVFSGLPQKQVANVLGVSVKAVESLLSRAKTKLKDSIRQQENDIMGSVVPGVKK